jgi:predicted nucleic acid-binding Zn ribbon protein
MYIFHCRECGREIELGAIPSTAVPCLCGKNMVRKYTVPNVHYHGSGFYSTDKLLTPVKPEDYDPLVD